MASPLPAELAMVSSPLPAELRDLVIPAVATAAPNLATTILLSPDLIAKTAIPTLAPEDILMVTTVMTRTATLAPAERATETAV